MEGQKKRGGGGEERRGERKRENRDKGKGRRGKTGEREKKGRMKKILHSMAIESMTLCKARVGQCSYCCAIPARLTLYVINLHTQISIFMN